jgi:diadenosine tetraphosphate (Ap4A) HIT family hydrolase
MTGCLFCGWVEGRKDEFIYDNDRFFAVADNFPVTLGHSLIIPKRHVATLFEFTEEEWASLPETLKTVRDYLKSHFLPNGFNYGVNEGEAAGQTKEHAHIHLIPRYEGDVQNPRGGVRNIIPGKGDYQEQNG